MSILNRTVFADVKGGIFMFWDWAKVTTTLGTMAEPFVPGSRWDVNQDFEEFDPDDEINRIDELRIASLDKEQLILSGGDQHLMGGATVPRSKR